MEHCNCRSWCRDWSETLGGKYPPSNHAPGCILHKKEPFTILEHDGTRCVMEPHEAELLMGNEPGEYLARSILLTRDQFERIPEFQGF